MIALVTKPVNAGDFSAPRSSPGRALNTLAKLQSMNTLTAGKIPHCIMRVNQVKASGTSPKVSHGPKPVGIISTRNSTAATLGGTAGRFSTRDSSINHAATMAVSLAICSTWPPPQNSCS